MSTFLFVSIPVTAHTTNPMPFAARLVEDGHRVIWLSGRTYHDRLATTGAEPRAYRHTRDFGGERFADAFPEAAGLSGVRAIRWAFEKVFVGPAVDRVADIRAITDETHVDAVLSDGISYGPGLAHELGGPPWATFGDGPLPYEDADTPPFGPGLMPMPGRAGRWRNAAVRTVGRYAVFGPAERRLAQIRRELGLPPGPGVLDSAPSPLLHLQGCMPGFDYPLADPPPHVHWVGPIRPDSMAWEPPPWWHTVAASARPVVFVSQGSLRPDVTELLVPTVRALAGLDVEVVVVTGEAAPADLEAAYDGPIPGNVHVTDFVPYDLALARADCFVTNGGYTGVTLALSHGTPMVQAGTTEEKAEIAARIEWSGVGVRLGTTRPSPEQVRDGVRRVLGEERYRAAARRLQAETACLDAGVMGAGLLERLAATGRPVLRSGSTDDVPCDPADPVGA